jgi:glutathione S-transferase
MKLYDTPLAPNPRRVRWFMAEKGIEDVEVVRVDLLKGDHKTPEFLGKAGLANVPMLEMDDGTCITESVAICRYLEEKYPEPNLFGRTAEERAVIEMWTRRGENLVSLPVMMTVRLTHPALAALEEPNPAVADYNRKNSLRGLKVLERQLAVNEWLAGDRITVADIIAFVGIDFGRMIKMNPPEELAHVTRWAETMRARPAARAGMPTAA